MPRTSNALLASLEEADFRLIGPHLRPFTLVAEDALAVAGQNLSRAYFPHSGVISLVLRLRDGDMVEVAMIGADSVFGAFAALSSPISLSDALVQQPGTASAIDMSELRRAADKSEAIRGVLMRHEQLVLLQAQQTAACNARHTAPARLSRYLLRMRDLCGRDEFVITQEYLAEMIGMKRNSVSIVAHALQSAGYIRYVRGRIQITNPVGLKDSACECYETVSAHYNRLLGKSRAVR
jgi:CRP-like cAMP-binding protein